MTSKMLRILTKGAKKLAITGLAAPALLLLCQGRAEAILNYYIFEDSGNLKIVTKGSLNLSGITPSSGATCTTPPPGGYINISFIDSIICSGVETSLTDAYNKYIVTGTSVFGAGNGSLSATSTSGIGNWLWSTETPDPSFYIIDPYIDGTAIDSSATFNGKNLQDLGLDSLSPGTNIGTWTFFNDTNPNNVINVIVGSPPSSPAPGPLPLLGAAGAYGWSRRLRRRIGSVSKR